MLNVLQLNRFGGTSTTSVSNNWGSAPAHGNTLLCAITLSNSSAGVNSIVQSGVTWVLDYNSGVIGGTSLKLLIFRGICDGTPGTLLTIGTSGTEDIAVNAIEVSGMVQTIDSTTESSSTNLPSTPTPAYIPEFLFCAEAAPCTVGVYQGGGEYSHYSDQANGAAACNIFFYISTNQHNPTPGNVVMNCGGTVHFATIGYRGRAKIHPINNQINHADSVNTGSFSISVAQPSNGNTLLLGLQLVNSVAGSPAVTSIVQSGAIWSLVRRQSGGSTNIELWKAEANTLNNPATTITVNVSPNVTDWGTNYEEYDGILVVSPTDQQTSTNGGSSPVVAGPTSMTTQADELFIGLVSIYGAGSGSLNSDPNNGFEVRNLVNFNDGGAGHFYGLATLEKISEIKDTPQSQLSYSLGGGSFVFETQSMMVTFKASPIQVVQAKAAASSGATTVVTFEDVPVDGNTIIAITGSQGGGVSNVAMTGGTFVIDEDLGFGGSNIWRASNLSSAGRIVTATNGVPDGVLVLYEVSGLDPHSPLDQKNSGGIHFTSNPDTGTTPPTTQPNEIFIGGFISNGGTTVNNPTDQFYGLTQARGLGMNPVTGAATYKIVGATGTARTSLTSAAGETWGSGIATYKAPSTGVPNMLMLMGAGTQ